MKQAWKDTVKPPQENLVQFWMGVCDGLDAACKRHRDAIIAMCGEEQDKKDVAALFQQLQKPVDQYALHRILAELAFDERVFRQQDLTAYNAADKQVSLEKPMIQLGLPKNLVDGVLADIDSVIDAAIAPHRRAASANITPG